MGYFLQQLINGITLGMIYGLITIEYTMVYGIIIVTVPLASSSNPWTSSPEWLPWCPSRELISPVSMGCSRRTANTARG